MSARKLLIAILSLSLLIEVAWPVLGFFATDFLLELFKIPSTPDVVFLAFVLSWLLLFVAIICGLALKLVLANQAMGWTLCYILGLWWVGIGGGLFLVHGRVDNLLLDGLKGALLFAAAYASRGEARA